MSLYYVIEFAAAQAVLQAQPFSRLLGARLTMFTPAGVHIDLEVRDDLRQQFGFVHGGVLAYLADNAITFACGLGLGSDIVTTGFTINYLEPARNGSQLRAEAELIHARRSTATARCTIYLIDDEAASPVATAVGSSMLRSRGA